MSEMWDFMFRVPLCHECGGPLYTLPAWIVMKVLRRRPMTTHPECPRNRP